MKNGLIKYVAYTINLAVASAFGLYVAVELHPELVLHQLQTPFLSTWSYFESFLNYPGGIAEYLSNGLMQLYHSNIIGALVILAIGLAIVGVGQLLIHGVFKRAYPNIVYPALILTSIILLKGSYLFPLAPLLSILIALVFAYITVITDRKGRLGLYLLPVFSILVYYLAGGLSLMLFGCVLILHFLLSLGANQRLLKSALALLLVLTIPFIAFRLVFPIPITQAFLYILPDTPVMFTFKRLDILYAFICFTPVFMLALGGYSQLTAYRSHSRHEEFDDQVDKLPCRFQRMLNTVGSYSFLFIQLVLVLLLGQYTHRSGVDRERRAVALADYHSQHHEWEKTLEVVASWPEYNFYLNFNFNLAHLMLGTLSEKAFHYPQLFGADALAPDRILAGGITMPASDFYYHLSYIPVSLVYAGEFQTLLPHSSRVLKRLTMSHLILGNYQAAQTYINVLEQSPLTSEWATEQRAYTLDTTLITNNDEVQLMRTLMPTNRLVEGTPEDKLRGLVTFNPQNRKAKDCLMIYLLLEHNLGAFVKLLSSDLTAGVNTIPRVYEEALLLFSVLSGSLPPELKSIRVNPSTIEDFNKFSRVLYESSGDKKRAQVLLRNDFGNTYWYYMRFSSPKVTGAKIEKRETP